MSAPVSSRPSVVVVGGGFAGFFAARTLERLLPVGAADLTIISATDHMCYSPLLPEVAAGRLNKQIAGDIGVSEITVKVHRGQVMRKMNATSLPDLARMADRLKLTPSKPDD